MNLNLQRSPLNSILAPAPARDAEAAVLNASMVKSSDTHRLLYPAPVPVEAES
jgi:hypothetical protein